MTNRDQALTNSDEIGFWEMHLPKLRGVGYQPPPEPAPVAEPDVSAMSMADYALYRAEHGIDSSEFIGVRPWRRPTPTPMITTE